MAGAEQKFHVFDRDDQLGPWTLDVIQGMWQRGELSHETMVCQCGRSEWKMLREMPISLPRVPKMTEETEDADEVYYQRLRVENDALKDAKNKADRRTAVLFAMVFGAVLVLPSLLLAIMGVYDWARSDAQVSTGWCGRYRSLVAWERETERGRVELWIAPEVVTVQSIFEGERLTPIWVKVKRALNGGDELRVWASNYDEDPAVIVREKMPGVLELLVDTGKYSDAELDWLPVERVR